MIGVSPEYIIERLADAGATLLALRVGGLRPAGPRSSMPEPLRTATEAYGYTAERIRVPPPSARAIRAMDEALSWILLIPADRPMLRRIVGLRAQVSPATGRYVVTWKALAELMGADERAVRAWHAQAIQMIVDALDLKSGIRPRGRPRGALRALRRLRRRGEVGRDLVDGIQVSDFD